MISPDALTFLTAVVLGGVATLLFALDALALAAAWWLVRDGHRR